MILEQTIQREDLGRIFGHSDTNNLSFWLYTLDFWQACGPALPPIFSIINYMVSCSLFFIILLTATVCNHKKASQTWSWLRKAPLQRTKSTPNIYVPRQKRGKLSFWCWRDCLGSKFRNVNFLLMTFINKIPTLKWEQFSQGKGECSV